MSSPTQGLQAGNDLVLNKSINNKLGPPDRCLRHLYELRITCENDTVVYRRELTATADGKVMDEPVATPTGSRLCAWSHQGAQ